MITLFIMLFVIASLLFDIELRKAYYERFKKYGYEKYIVKEFIGKEAIMKINFNLCTNVYEAEALYKVIMEENVV